MFACMNLKTSDKRPTCPTKKRLDCERCVKPDDARQKEDLSEVDCVGTKDVAKAAISPRERASGRADVP